MADVVLVQLRLRPEEAAELRAAAEANGRSLPGEIRHRAMAPEVADGIRDGGQVGSIDRALSDLVRYLASTAQIFRDPARERAEYLGIVRAAIDRALSDLGAATPDADDSGAANSIAAVAMRAVRSPEPDDNPRLESIRQSFWRLEESKQPKPKKGK